VTSQAAAGLTSARPVRAEMLRVVVAYAVFATLWILFSDTLIGRLSDNPGTLVMLGTLKGLAFVALTSLLLYALLRRVGGTDEATAAPVGNHRLVAWVVGLALLILLAGAAAMRQVAQRHEALAAAQLHAMARLKVGQIEAWLDERRKDIEIIRHSPLLIGALRRWQRDGDAASTTQAHAQLAAVLRIGGYRSIAVLDVTGARLLAAGGDDHLPDDLLDTVIKRALSSEASQFADLSLDRAGGGMDLSFDFVAPLPAADGAPALVIVLRADENDFVLPLLQVLPVPSASAETLLVRRDSDSVLLLYAPRDRAGSALPRRIPTRAAGSLLVQASSAGTDAERPHAARDYRDVPVLGVGIPVADTAWWLIAKIDREEVDQALRNDLFWITVSVASALFAVVFFGVMLGQQQRLRLSESVRQAQAEALRVQQLVDRQRQERGALVSHYETMVGKARDIILLVDDAGRIVEANEAAVAAYGWSLDELRALHVRDLQGEDTLAVFTQQWQASANPEGALFEARHRRRDGSSFPVEISSRMIEIEGKPYRQSFIRDISERRKAASALQRSNRALRTLSECNQALIRADNEPALLAEICQLVVHFGGYRMAWVGYVDDDELHRVRPVAQAGFEDGDLATADVTTEDVARGRGPSGTAIRERRPVLAQNLVSDPHFGPWRDAALRRGYAASIALPLLTADGACLGALNLYTGAADAFDTDETRLLVELAGDLAYGIRALRDRAARDSAEATLRATAQQLQHLLEASPTVLYALRVADGATRTVQVSANIERISGHTVAEALQDDWWAAGLHPDDRHAALAARLLPSAAATVHEYRFAHKDGHYLWIRDEQRLIRDAAGQAAEIVGAWTDITTARLASLALQDSEKRYREMFTENPLPMWVFDQATLAFLEVNDAAIRHYGYTREEFLTMTIKDIRPTEEIPRLLARLAETGANGANGEAGAWRHRCKDGREILVDIIAHALDSGTAHVVLANDITEREQDKARLLAQLEELRRWHEVTRNREGRVLQLKREVNALLAEAGRQPRYGAVKAIRLRRCA
jgi:PAS domain S-box-containing protein